MKVLWSVALTFALLADAALAQSPAPSASRYGAYPADYKAIVMAWLDAHLDDPKRAVVEWSGEPKPAELPGPAGQKISGYLVEFTVNARNRFGAYTGKQRHGALIRDGTVVKTTGFGYR